MVHQGHVSIVSVGFAASSFEWRSIENLPEHWRIFNIGKTQLRMLVLTLVVVRGRTAEDALKRALASDNGDVTDKAFLRKMNDYSTVASLYPSTWL